MKKTVCKYKRNQKYVQKGLMILTFIFSLCFISCEVEQNKFDKNTWNDMDDIMYANRESMISDLMTNNLRQGMTYMEVVELLGKPENYANIKSNTIGYEIMVDYGWNIDPVKGKTLYIEFTNDSKVNDFKLEEWTH
jgi:outer membrane protein assembly factor BamE (lipoprotein component of BamABCDE complex)